MSDARWNGRRFRTFNAVDGFNRQALAIEIASACRPGGSSGHWIVWRLGAVISATAEPGNGQGCMAAEMAQWAGAQRGIGIHQTGTTDAERLHNTLQPYRPGGAYSNRSIVTRKSLKPISKTHVGWVKRSGPAEIHDFAGFAASRLNPTCVKDAILRQVLVWVVLIWGGLHPMNPHFLVVGGGVIGINIARELKRRFTDASVHLLEKETTSTAHASGRNSGILHAGFYYTADSLKARFTRQGNSLLTQYCLDKGIPINRCGKLVVAQSERDLPLMNVLLDRARANCVELHDITAQEAKKIEPRVKTLERALFSPTTSSVDPGEVVAEMARDAVREGVVIQYGTVYQGSRNGIVRTNRGNLTPGYLVNAAGLYADKVARD